MVNIEKSRHDVYYLHTYIPKHSWNSLDDEDEDVSISKKILDFKDKKAYAMNFFTKELADAIVEVANSEIDKKFRKLALVSIPSSTNGNVSSITKIIPRIIRLYEKNPDRYEFFNIREVHNCSSLLVREKSVKPSHIGDRVKYYEHIFSIECMREFHNAEDIAFLLVDDITTTGCIMKVCKDILIDYYINEDNIYKLAIGQTW